MRRSRPILLAAVLVAVLCAYRADVAAFSPRPEAVPLAGRIVARLKISFRQTVPAVRLAEHLHRVPTDAFVSAPTPSLLPLPRLLLSPFQFRLPPPQLA